MKSERKQPAPVEDVVVLTLTLDEVQRIKKVLYVAGICVATRIRIMASRCEDTQGMQGNLITLDELKEVL